MSPTKYAPHVIFMIGFVVLLTVAVPNSQIPLGPESRLAIGLIFAVLGGAWYDARRQSDDEYVLAHLFGPLGYVLYGSDSPTTWKDWTAQIAGLVGLLFIFASTTAKSLPTVVGTGLGVVGAVLLLIAAYWNQHGRAVQSYDERQLRIRHRAAYVALWVVSVLLVGSYLIGVMVIRPEGDRGELATALIAASAVPLITGLLVFKITEGYLERRM